MPAARRKLAQTRLKMLSTLVLMGINRIVVTGGKIRATMGFHINTRDTAHAGERVGRRLRASATSGSFGVGPWSASASMSVAYVSSTKADSNAELNTQTDLTGEVEIHFQSDYFPIERFADSAGIDQIRGNTPVPPRTRRRRRRQIPWGDTSPPRPAEPMAPRAAPLRRRRPPGAAAAARAAGPRRRRTPSQPGSRRSSRSRRQTAGARSRGQPQPPADDAAARSRPPTPQPHAPTPPRAATGSRPHRAAAPQPSRPQPRPPPAPPAMPRGGRTP